MSTTDGYFQFPLCLLASKDPWPEICIQIAGYSTGAWIVQTTAKEEGTDDNCWNEGMIKRARSALNFSNGDLNTICKRYQQAAQIINEHEAKFGRDCMVRLKSTYLFESRDGTGLTEIEMRALIAIYSHIGDKAYSHVAEPVIGIRAAGCKSKSVFEALQLKGDVHDYVSKRSKPLRNAVVKLELDGFYAKATIGGNQAFFSHRMTEEKLREELVKRFTKPEKIQARIQRDREMMARIQRLQQRPLEGHSGAT